MSREIFDWPALPPELQLHVLSFVRYPYLMLLLTIPTFATYLRGSWNDLLKKEYSRMHRYSPYLSCFIDSWFSTANTAFYLYDGQLSYRHEIDDGQITLVLSLSEGRIYKWVFIKLFGELKFRLQVTMHWLNQRLARIESCFGDARLRVRYQGEQVHYLYYRDTYRRAMILDVHMEMVTNSKGALRGEWLLCCPDGVLLRRTYQGDEICTTYYEALPDYLQRLIFNGSKWGIAITRFILYFSPSFPLLMLRMMREHDYVHPGYWLSAQLAPDAAQRQLHQCLSELAITVSPGRAISAAAYQQETSVNPEGD